MKWQHPLHLDKYQYAKTNPYAVRIVGALGIAASVSMGIGFWKFFQIDLRYLLVFGPIVFIFLLNKTLRYILQLFYQGFDIQKHEKFVSEYWKQNSEPSVDIFLPFAGENLDVHSQVVNAVHSINYTNYKVYMLDDAGSAEHKALAESFGFTYLSRPNKGEYKKSGNLEFGYANSNGEFIFILDADFIPTADSLRDIIPYISCDPSIGILQTPQYFEQTEDVHKRSKIEFGGGNIVEEFYRIIMPSRDEFKAAMCVGTSAVYRRETINKLEGTPKVHASEDLATGLLITRYGYYVKYLPLIVSMGTSPETYQGYFKQHQRWCSGNIVFAKYWPAAKLSLMARLIYLINPLYYLSEALSVIFSFQFLVLLYFHSDNLALVNSFYFIPYIVVSRVIVPSMKSNKSKSGTRLAALNNSYTYLYTYIQMLTSGVPKWHPTGLKIKGLHPDFERAINLGSCISAVHIILFATILLVKPALLGNPNTYLVILWSLYNTSWHVRYLYSVARFMHPYGLQKTRTAIGKTFLTAKTHTMFMLFLILIGSVLIDLWEVVRSPSSTIVANLQQMLPKTMTPIVTKIDSPESTEAIETQNSRLTGENTTYRYTYNYGDTLRTLADAAVNDYTRTSNNYLDNTTKVKLALALADSITRNRPINYGEEIVFYDTQIKQYIEDISNGIELH